MRCMSNLVTMTSSQQTAASVQCKGCQLPVQDTDATLDNVHDDRRITKLAEKLMSWCTRPFG